jgi:hypothetical protein
MLTCIMYVSTSADAFSRDECKYRQGKKRDEWLAGWNEAWDLHCKQMEEVNAVAWSPP